jgi:hypothetical protein
VDGVKVWHPFLSMDTSALSACGDGLGLFRYISSSSTQSCLRTFLQNPLTSSGSRLSHWGHNSGVLEPGIPCQMRSALIRLSSC